MPEVAIVSHGIGATAFLFIALILFCHPTRSKAPWIIVACSCTALWAGLATLYGLNILQNYQWVVLSEVAQDGSWCFALLHLLRAHRAGNATFSQKIVPWLLSLGLGLMAVNALFIHHQWLPGHSSTFVLLDFMGHLILSIAGLSLIEQLYRGIKPHRRWGIKYFCLSIGALFTYDFFMYAHALLFEQLDANLWYARGAINLIVAPLIIIASYRNKDWQIELSPSRAFIYRSTVIVTCGLYLIAMATIGYALKLWGGHWGHALSIVFLFGAGLLLSSLLFSGKARAFMKTMLAKHVFKLYYDYREEWLHFSQLLGHTQGEDPLPTRIIMAFAAMVESPQGVLYELKEGSFVLKNSWNVSQAPAKFDRLLSHLSEQHLSEPVLLESLAKEPKAQPLVDAFKSYPTAWLIVPFYLEDKLYGFVVLGRPRVKVSLNWEVKDLLSTASNQAAIFLHQQTLSEALHVAKQFESYHQISAFMLHDIKNLLSSTHLLLQNKKHASDPRFVDTIFITLESVHSKLTKLQSQLHNPSDSWQSEPVELYFELQQITAQYRLKGRSVLLNESSGESWVHICRESFKHGIMHLIDNALEATCNEQAVTIDVSQHGQAIHLIIEDKGEGMSQHFIDHDLFRPFRSTKGQKGMGIGAFQVKSLVEKARGTLNVESTVGQGTRFELIFPEYKRKQPVMTEKLEEQV